MKSRLALCISTLCVLIMGMSSTVVMAAQPTEGFAVELRGLQSHYSGVNDDIGQQGDWETQNKFNEIGIALRWEWANHWFVEAAASRGSDLRFLRESGEDEEGNPEFDEDFGRSYALKASVGKRFWVNEYFSVMPSAGVMQRNLHVPDDAASGFNGHRQRDTHFTAGLIAEYRVISRFAISLNFTMLSSGERQQGIGIAYYGF